MLAKVKILLLTSLLVACDVKLPPSEQLKNLQSTPKMTHTAAALQQSDVFTRGDWPDPEWWRVYHAPLLNALMQDALLNNPSIQAIQHKVDVAKQETIVARSVLFPLVFFNGADTKHYISKNGLYRVFNPQFPLHAYYVDLALSFQYEIDFWWKYHNLFYAAIGKERALQAEAAEVKLVVTTAMAQAYFAYVTNNYRKILYQELVQVRQDIDKLNTLLLQKGLVSALPPLLSHERVNAAKKLLANIDKECQVDLHLVNILAGRSPETPLPIHLRLPKLPKHLTIPKTLQLELLARRPDLMAQIWRAKSWAYKTGAAIADFYPNFNVVGLLGLQSVALSKLFEVSSISGVVHPAFHLPIFTAGEIRANARAHKAEFDAAISDYNNLLLKSTQNVLDVLVFATAVYQQKQAQVRMLQASTQRYTLTKLRAISGLDSQLDADYFYEDVIKQKLMNIVLLYNQYLASVKLVKALGGGYVQKCVPLERASE